MRRTGVADERSAVFADGVDSIMIAVDAAGAQGLMYGFVAWIRSMLEEQLVEWRWRGCFEGNDVHDLVDYPPAR